MRRGRDSPRAHRFEIEPIPRPPLLFSLRTSSPHAEVCRLPDGPSDTRVIPRAEARSSAVVWEVEHVGHSPGRRVVELELKLKPLLLDESSGCSAVNREADPRPVSAVGTRGVLPSPERRS